MESEQYYDDRNNYRADMDEPLGEDGPTPDVTDLGLFGRRHSDYDADYSTSSELAGRHRRPPMPYNGGYGDGYGGKLYEQRPPEVVYEGGFGGRPPPPMYGEPVETVTSDLGTGLMDSQTIRTRPDSYTSGYGESDLTPYDVDRGLHGKRHGHSKEDAVGEELDEERKHKHYAEAVAAAAIGYGLYKRHQKNDAKEKLEQLGYDSDGKKKHSEHRFRDY